MTAPQHPPNVARVPPSLVPVAIVEQNMHLSRAFGQPPHSWRPLFQLPLLVQIFEALRRADPLAVPRLRVAAVQTHESHGPGRSDDRRNAILEPLRLLHTNLRY